MTSFIIKKRPYDFHTHVGLALIGKHLKRGNINRLIDPKFPVHLGAHNNDILKSYQALMWLRKSDFDAIEILWGDALCMRALGLGIVQLGSRCANTWTPTRAS